MEWFSMLVEGTLPDGATFVFEVPADFHPGQYLQPFDADDKDRDDD